jgi:hypothetical protein
MFFRVIVNKGIKTPYDWIQCNFYKHFSMTKIKRVNVFLHCNFTKPQWSNWTVSDCMLLHNKGSLTFVFTFPIVSRAKKGTRIEGEHGCKLNNFTMQP